MGIVKTSDLLESRRGCLDHLLGDFYPRLPLALCILDRAKFVHPPQSGLVKRRGKFGSDTPDADASALIFEAFDQPLVQVIARDDGCIMKSSLIEQVSSLDAKVGKIARVEADTNHSESFASDLLSDFDRIANALEGVVGIDKKDTVVGHYRGIGFKGFELGIERHDPAMSVGSADRNTVFFSCQYVARRRAATDIRSAACRQPTVGSLGPSQAKLQHGILASDSTHARRFGCDQGLEVDDIQQSRLEQLAL